MVGNTTRIDHLREAVDTFNRPRADEICTEPIADLRLRDDALTPAEAKGVLELLQRKRHFALLQRVADALVHSGLDLPIVRRHYAQALLDQEMLTAGLAILEDLVAATVDEPHEHAEARALVGRAYKQLYVLTGPSVRQRRAAFLQRAVAAYDGVLPRTRGDDGMGSTP